MLYLMISVVSGWTDQKRTKLVPGSPRLYTSSGESLIIWATILGAYTAVRERFTPLTGGRHLYQSDGDFFSRSLFLLSSSLRLLSTSPSWSSASLSWSSIFHSMRISSDSARMSLCFAMASGRSARASVNYNQREYEGTYGRGGGE